MEKEINTLKAVPPAERTVPDLLHRPSPLRADSITLSATGRSPGPTPAYIDELFIVDASIGAVRPFRQTFETSDRKGRKILALRIPDESVVGSALNVFARDEEGSGSSFGGFITMRGVPLRRLDDSERAIENISLPAGHFDFFLHSLEIEPGRDVLRFRLPTDENRWLMTELTFLNHLRRIGRIMNDPNHTYVFALDGYNPLRYKSFIDKPGYPGYETLLHVAANIPRENIETRPDSAWEVPGLARRIYEIKKNDPSAIVIVTGVSSGGSKAIAIAHELEKLRKKQGAPLNAAANPRSPRALPVEMMSASIEPRPSLADPLCADSFPRLPPLVDLLPDTK